MGQIGEEQKVLGNIPDHGSQFSWRKDDTYNQTLDLSSEMGRNFFYGMDFDNCYQDPSTGVLFGIECKDYDFGGWNLNEDWLIDKEKMLYYTLNQSEVISSTDFLSWGGSQLELTVTIGITNDSSSIKENLIVTTKFSSSSGLWLVGLLVLFLIIGLGTVFKLQK